VILPRKTTERIYPINGCSSLTEATAGLVQWGTPHRYTWPDCCKILTKYYVERYKKDHLAYNFSEPILCDKKNFINALWQKAKKNCTSKTPSVRRALDTVQKIEAEADRVFSGRDVILLRRKSGFTATSTLNIDVDNATEKPLDPIATLDFLKQEKINFFAFSSFSNFLVKPDAGPRAKYRLVIPLCEDANARHVQYTASIIIYFMLKHQNRNQDAYGNIDMTAFQAERFFYVPGYTHCEFPTHPQAVNAWPITPEFPWVYYASGLETLDTRDLVATHASMTKSLEIPIIKTTKKGKTWKRNR